MLSSQIKNLLFFSVALEESLGQPTERLLRWQQKQQTPPCRDNGSKLFPAQPHVKVDVRDGD